MFLYTNMTVLNTSHTNPVDVNIGVKANTKTCSDFASLSELILKWSQSENIYMQAGGPGMELCFWVNRSFESEPTVCVNWIQAVEYDMNMICYFIVSCPCPQQSLVSKGTLSTKTHLVLFIVTLFTQGIH